MVRLAQAGEFELSTSAAVVAQLWRDGPRQARLARLLGADGVTESPLDSMAARHEGAILARFGWTDVVDAHVVVLAERRGTVVVTSDADDLARLGLRRDRIVPC